MWPAFIAFICLFAGNVAVSVPFIVVAAVLLARQGGVASIVDLMSVPLLMERLPLLMVASLLVTVLLTVGTALIAFRLANQPLAAIAAPSRLRPGWLAAFGLFLATIGYGAVSGWIVVALGGFENSTLDGFERLCLALPPAGFAVLLLGGSLGPGFGEELLFRGFIQPRLAARWGPWAGIVITASLFGLMHMDLAQGSFAIGMGVITGWVTHRAGTLWPAMLAHAANNGMSFALTRLAGRTPAELPPLVEAVPYLLALLLGLAMLGAMSRHARAPAVG